MQQQSSGSTSKKVFFFQRSPGHLTWCTCIVRKTWDSRPSAPRWSSQSPSPLPAAHVPASSPHLPPPPPHLAPWASLRLDGFRAKQPESPVQERRPRRATPGTLATPARRATEATWERRGTGESGEGTGEARWPAPRCWPKVPELRAAPLFSPPGLPPGEGTASGPEL